MRVAQHLPCVPCGRQLGGSDGAVLGGSEPGPVGGTVSVQELGWPASWAGYPRSVIVVQIASAEVVQGSKSLGPGGVEVDARAEDRRHRRGSPGSGVRTTGGASLTSPDPAAVGEPTPSLQGNSSLAGTAYRSNPGPSAFGECRATRRRARTTRPPQVVDPWASVVAWS